MAGRGRPPQDPNTRAGHSKRQDLRVVQADPAPQPDLPEVWVDDELFVWPSITRTWWAMWRDSPLAPEFTDNDWSELRDTAFLHAQYWKGKMSLAAELRLRVAKFGATPEDRARLRITFAQAADADGSSGTRRTSSRSGVRLVSGE